MDKKKIYVDTDFLSSFLKVGEANFLHDQLLKYEPYIPYFVDKEIKKYKSDTKLSFGYKSLVDSKTVKVLDEFDLDNYEPFIFFMEITSLGYRSKKMQLKSIGDGEAEAITRAHFDGGMIASNNLRDITDYCIQLNIDYITGPDLMVNAYNCNEISEEKLNAIWSKMIKVGEKLPTSTFSEYKNKESK